MPESDISGASRPTRTLIASSLVIWAVLAVALPLAALTLNVVKIAEIPLGFWVTSQGALFGLALLAIVFAYRSRGVASGEGIRPAMVFGAEALGSIAIVGAAGAVAALGYDGLPVALGLVAGLSLMTILVAPRFVLYPVQSVGGYFAARFGGIWPRRTALVITAIAGMLLLAADIRGGALGVQGLAGVGYITAIVAATVITALVWLIRGMLAPRRSAGLAYVVIGAASLVVLAGFAVSRGAFPLPYLNMGDALSSLAARDQQLVIDKLADVAVLQPMASPFLKQSMVNFAGLMLAVAFGIATAPHLIGRHVSRGAVAPGDAVRRAAFATLFVALLIAGIAPLAVHARLGFSEQLVKGIESAAIPKPFADTSGAAWISVCGRQSAEPVELAEACAKMPGQRGFVRLQDIGRPTDSFIVAAPSLAGLPGWAAASLYGALLFGALVAGHGILGGVLGVDAEARSAGSAEQPEFDLRSGLLGLLVILVAAALAAQSGLDIVALGSDGLALAAAGLFPALVLSLYWRGLSGAGALAAMFTGFLITAVYIAGVRFWPQELFALTGGLSDASSGEIRKLAALSEAVQRAADPAALDLSRAALDRQAAKVANWWGLKPGAIVLVAVPAGLLAGILASTISGWLRGRAAGR